MTVQLTAAARPCWILSMSACWETKDMPVILLCISACRSATLAKEIGAYHIKVAIDSLITALVTLFAQITGVKTCRGAD